MVARFSFNMTIEKHYLKQREKSEMDWHNLLSCQGELQREAEVAGGGGIRTAGKVQKRSKKSVNANQSDKSGAAATSTSSSKSGVNHDLNLRLDISFRSQAAITRDIALGTSSASSGNSAFKISFMADYTLSRLMTITAYYDQQTNTPLLASSSYPTTTRDFGLSLKFSLTRW